MFAFALSSLPSHPLSPHTLPPPYLLPSLCCVAKCVIRCALHTHNPPPPPSDIQDSDPKSSQCSALWRFSPLNAILPALTVSAFYATFLFNGFSPPPEYSSVKGLMNKSWGAKISAQFATRLDLGARVSAVDIRGPGESWCLGNYIRKTRDIQLTWNILSRVNHALQLVWNSKTTRSFHEGWVHEVDDTGDCDGWEIKGNNWSAVILKMHRIYVSKWTRTFGWMRCWVGWHTSACELRAFSPVLSSADVNERSHDN